MARTNIPFGFGQDGQPASDMTVLGYVANTIFADAPEKTRVDVTARMPASVIADVQAQLGVPPHFVSNGTQSLIRIYGNMPTSNVFTVGADKPATLTEQGKRVNSKAPVTPAAVAEPPPPVTLDIAALENALQVKAQAMAEVTGMDVDVLLTAMRAKYDGQIAAAQADQEAIATLDTRITDLQAQLDAARAERQGHQDALGVYVAALQGLMH